MNRSGSRVATPGTKMISIMTAMMIPMTGTIDWNDVFDALDEINYQGTYNMELNLCHFGKKFAVETAAFAVKVMRFMLDERYGKN